MLGHRNDIDGLRSVAVIPIMLFHAGFGLLRGGYTGVDIFFVISGFLITKTIMDDLERGQFSILKFYQRRIARILPALFFMLIITGLAVGPALILPGEISNFFYSSAAASGFVSNIFFWNEVGYFARAAESQPILHTWSLGVEEQFYIFFPLIILALRNFNTKIKIIFLAILCIISLSSGILIHKFSPTSDFYLIPFRAWELLIGAMLALDIAPKLSPKLAELSAAVGAVLIIASIFLLVSWLPFPSPFALLPCVGTALVIAYGDRTRVGHVLALAPLRWVGLISFSLYLWHWPIITLYREMTGDHIAPSETIALIAASFIAASISYYLVEQPARKAIRLWKPQTAVAAGSFATIAMIVGSLTLATNADRIWPVNDAVESIANYQNYKDVSASSAEEIASSACFVNTTGNKFKPERCLAIDPDKSNVLLFGDSHAEMYGAALRKANPGINWLQATHIGCPPVRNGWLNPGCSAMVGIVLDQVVTKADVDIVIMADRWREELAPKLAETIKLMRDRGITVIVIGPVPEYQGSLPTILARAIQSGRVDSAHGFMKPDIATTDEVIRATTERAGAQYYSAYEAICPTAQCELFAPDGGPMAFDYGHLTFSGASYALRNLKLSQTPPPQSTAPRP